VTSSGARRIAVNDATGAIVARNHSKTMFDLAQGDVDEIEAGKPSRFWFSHSDRRWHLRVAE